MSYPSATAAAAGRQTTRRAASAIHDARPWFDVPALDFEGAFTGKKWKGEIAEARKASLLKRIVRKAIAKEGQDTPYKSEKGQPLVVRPFPFFEKTSHLRNYGCPIAVNLYMRFQKECGGLFVIMFLIALPDLANNVQRNVDRNDCRAFTDLMGPYEAVTNATSAHASCGWEGLPIRKNLTALNWYLQTALGTCQEYTSADSRILPVRSVANATFVPTPGASYCQTEGGLSSAAYWFQFLNVLLFFVFLVRMRSMQRRAALDQDLAWWTASDYTVLVSGLEERTNADDQPVAGQAEPKLGLESRVRADLERMGFHKKLVVHVEVGRYCSEEMKVFAQYAAVKIKIQERHARLKKRGKESDGDEKMRRLYERRKELIDVLEDFRREPDETTGHAFITFLYEKDRNRLIKMCRPSKRAWLRCGLGFLCCIKDERPQWDACGPHKPSRPRVEIAPEPDDVRWENLQLGGRYEAKATIVTVTLTAALLVLATVGIVGVKVAQSNFEEDVGGDVADGGTGGESVDGGSTDLISRATLLSGISLAASLFTVVINYLLKWLITVMAKKEGLDTQTEYETSLFAKLSLAYTFNTAIMPLLTGMYFSLQVAGRPVTQSWYEAGGVVNQAIFLMISNAIIADLLKVIQVGPLIKRYVLAPFVVSQQRLNELFAPPDMLLGELYAANLKTVALCLLYAPLWPLAYLLTAVALGITFLATKYAVSKWYKKPPQISEEMMDKMRARLGFLMLLHTIVAALGANAAYPFQTSQNVFQFLFSRDGGGFQTGAAAPIVAMLVAWLLYELLDTPDCLGFFKWFREFDAVERTQVHVGNTQDVPYHTDPDNANRKGVEDALGYPIDAYICPTAREDGKFSNEFLLKHIFKDWAEDEEVDYTRHALPNLAARGPSSGPAAYPTVGAGTEEIQLADRSSLPSSAPLPAGSTYGGNYPSQPAVAYPSQPAVAYPSQPAVAYPSQPAVAYPSQPAVAYLSQPAVAYPSQPPAGNLYPSAYPAPTTSRSTYPNVYPSPN